MNRRTFYSLIPGFVLCLFLLISLPLNDLASLEEMNHPDRQSLIKYMKDV